MDHDDLKIMRHLERRGDKHFSGVAAVVFGFVLGFLAALVLVL